VRKFNREGKSVYLRVQQPILKIELDEAPAMDGCGFAGLHISQRYIFTS
jgi:hypothetical protein